MSSDSDRREKETHGKPFNVDLRALSEISGDVSSGMCHLGLSVSVGRSRVIVWDTGFDTSFDSVHRNK